VLSNLFYILEVAVLLIGILVSCQVFTNAIENLGTKLNLAHEFTGSVLAAVGTALPETILPLVAIYMASQGLASGVEAKTDIAIGAIIGAPFMLSTLAMLLLGISIFVHKKKRKEIFSKKYPDRQPEDARYLMVNINHLKRDLVFFLITFSISISATFLASNYITQLINYLCTKDWGVKLISLFKLEAIPNACYEDFGYAMKLFFALLILISYITYIVFTYKASKKEIGEEDEHDSAPVLYMKQYFKLPDNLAMVTTQTLIGLAAIIYFAHDFVKAIEHFAEHANFSPLVLSLIIAPIATELPEKVNSWIWSSEGKDTLAMGNLSGAMVFQSAIPCMIGVLLTPWELTRVVFICVTISVISALILLTKASTKARISDTTLIFTGSLYFLYLLMVFRL
jgi:cation:H+ antiporter